MIKRLFHFFCDFFKKKNTTFFYEPKPHQELLFTKQDMDDHIAVFGRKPIKKDTIGSDPTLKIKMKLY